MPHTSHKADAPVMATIAVVSISSTRSLDDDVSGHWISDQVPQYGHRVVSHAVVPDDVDAIRRHVVELINASAPDVMLLTGGTGIAPKDVTIEAVQPLFEKEMSAFGAIFAQLSFEEIGSPAMLSRATAGVIQETVLFCMPGSLKACQLACERLVFSEIGHMVRHRTVG